MEDFDMAEEKQLNLQIGMILLDTQTDVNNPPEYRIIYVKDQMIVLCKMNIPRFDFVVQSIPVLTGKMLEGNIILKEEHKRIFDFTSLPETIQPAFNMKKDIVNQIAEAYGPDFLILQTKKSKPLIKDLARKYKINVKTIERLMRVYLQAGFDPVSLLDRRLFREKEGYGKKDLKHKTGKPTRIIPAGKNLSSQDLDAFAWALKKYKSGRSQSLKKCFDLMNANFYSTQISTENGAIIKLLPPTERPTFNQFYYYVRCHLTPEEKDRIKTSKMEQRNNKRLLFSDSKYNVKGPCDRFQMDEVEVDVFLRSSIRDDITIGRPIVYIMHDVYSDVITAVGIAFDNNSILGMTNCFLNLSDNKVDYCKKYGIEITESMWPSCVLPRRILVDRGSEYCSNETARIFNELNIHRELASAGTGSLKGDVEQFFHEMHANQNPYLEKNGLIEKRFDSSHKKDAALTLDEFTKLLLNFIIKRNNTGREGYPLTADMVAEGVEPIPVKIWEYGCRKYGKPVPITNIPQYYYTLMRPQKANIDRKGIRCNDLFYIDMTDPDLMQEMYKTQNKRSPIEVRMDVRDIGAVYYSRNGNLHKAALNDKKTGQTGFAGLTLTEWNQIRNYLKQKQKERLIRQEDYDAYIAKINETIVKNARKLAPASTSHLKADRRLEKISFPGKSDLNIQ